MNTRRIPVDFTPDCRDAPLPPPLWRGLCRPGGLSGRNQRRGARYGRLSSCTTPGGPMPCTAPWHQRSGTACRRQRKSASLFQDLTNPSKWRPDNSGHDW